MKQDDEYLDLVNESDKVIGREKRSLVYARNQSNFRVINAFVRNKKGEIWIPRRAPDKRIFPSCLDMSVGGHVSSGESYEEAFERETREELRINVKKAEIKYLGNLTPHQHNVSAFMAVFEIALESAPDYNPDDFTQYYWLKPSDIVKMYQSGEKMKSDLPKLIERFYLIS